MNSVAVLIDRFLLGGRQTYVVEVLDELTKNINLRCGLIARNITESPHTEIFDCKYEIGRENSVFRLQTDLQQFISTLKPKVIWAHHSEFLLGLVLSGWQRIPMLPTFHTPFRDGTTWNSPLLHLGSALAINRCPLIAGVSEEILRSLVMLGADESKLRLLSNRVQIIKPSEEKYEEPHIRVVLLTRSRKREHIRAAVSFFYAFRRVLPSARMTIYSGEYWGESNNGYRDDLVSKVAKARRLVGTHWLAKNLWCLRDLPAIEFSPPTSDARSVIRNADIVLGMGRVLLEALSLGKPAILVGYQHVIGKVSLTNFQRYKFTNLSGRDITPNPIKKIVAETIASVHEGSSTPPEILREIDISNHWKVYASTFDDAIKKWDAKNWNYDLNWDCLCSENFNWENATDRLLSIANERELGIFRKLCNLSAAPIIVR